MTAVALPTLSWYRVTVQSGWAWRSVVAVEAHDVGEACARIVAAGYQLHREWSGLLVIERAGDRYTHPLGGVDADGTVLDRRRLAWGATQVVTVA